MRRCLPALLALCVVPTACGPSSDAHSPTRAPLASQWFERAKVSYRSGDFDDARESAKKALEVAPSDPDARELAARIALVRLDYAEALRLTEGLTSSQAHGVRGRAYWLSGDIEHAADELEALLADPTVKDAWAQDVAGLARRGVGRHPFAMDGALVAVIDVPRAIERVPLGAAMVVPCELDGERVLALMATGTSEVVLDSNSRREPAWVSFRFDRVEIDDVPALVQDLSAISRQLGVPIKAMLGAQLLRHAHATFDRRGDQFIVRRRDAPPPPDASRVPLFYMRGGGMLLRAAVTMQDDAAIPFYVDSSRNFPLLLKDAAWQKAGIDPRSLASLPDSPTVKTGTVPTFRMGGFDLAKMPALEGIDMTELSSGTDVDLAGVVGADLLSFFRVTFADEGRFMWIEPDPSLIASTAGGAEAPPAAASPSSPSLQPPTPGPFTLPNPSGR
jgi:tetratricopeptide (TPR) repeat protein